MLKYLAIGALTALMAACTTRTATLPEAEPVAEPISVAYDTPYKAPEPVAVSQPTVLEESATTVEKEPAPSHAAELQAPAVASIPAVAAPSEPMPVGVPVKVLIGEDDPTCPPIPIEEREIDEFISNPETGRSCHVEAGYRLKDVGPFRPGKKVRKVG